MSDKVLKLQSELEKAISEAKKISPKITLASVMGLKPGMKIYKGQGSFRAQGIKRIQERIEQIKKMEANK